jgi:hypothetical protein
MKVCYVDETGTGDSSPIIVMAGIVADAQRLNRTREEFSSIFDEIQRLFPEALSELKSTRIFYGKDRWRNVDPKERKRIFAFFCRWIVERKHKLALTAIDKKLHATTLGDGAPEKLKDIWLTGALHIALQIQRAHQGEEKNKGNTFLIFDENKAKIDHLPELLYAPPAWTDCFYEKKKRRLN